MLKIYQTKFNEKPYLVNNAKSILNAKNHSIFFTSKYSIGNLPKDLYGVDISKINEVSKNVLDVNTIGYLAEIIKYKAKKIYAIKRVWSAEKAKHQTANPIEQMKIEAEVYKKLGKLKNIPKFIYYNGYFTNDNKDLLNNYLIMSWVKGKPASTKGVFYNFDLVNNRTIKKIFKMMNKFDNAGIIHNDLWAGNILFESKDVNIIDFNRSYFFDQNKEFEKNNLKSFKKRFLNRYLSDVYQKKGEEHFLKTFKNCIKYEKDYYKNLKVFYSKNKNSDGFCYYNELEKSLKDLLMNPELLKQKGIKTIFKSDLHCAEVNSKYFEFNKDEAKFHYEKALGLLRNYPEITGKEKANLIKANNIVVSNLSKVIKQGKDFDESNIKKTLNLLNDEKIYSSEEQKKPYYNMFRNFCEFNIKYKKTGETIKDWGFLIKEHSSLTKNKKLQKYLASLKD